MRAPRAAAPRARARGASVGRSLAVAALSLAVAALSLAVAAPPPPAAHAHDSASDADVMQCARTSGSTTIESIRFTSPDGVYSEGDTIGIAVTASHDFDGGSGLGHIMSHTRIKLETGGVDRFANFSGHVLFTPVINYTYTVQEGDASGDLDYHSTRALHWNIRHTDGGQPMSTSF